jgi:GTP cyclohydrolase IB
MLMKKIKKGEMPDVASHSSSVIYSPIDWVGMDEITIPFEFMGESSVAKAHVHVNVLNPSAKGIHMSRLFLAVGQNLLKQKMTLPVLQKTMRELITSQEGLSDKARLVLRWEQPIQRKALLSDNKGWKTYPMQLVLVQKATEFKMKLTFSTYYASTCPCSAALARQLVQNAFKNQFAKRPANFDEIYNWLGQNQIASPHSQRSRADVNLVFHKGQETMDVLKYIDAIEGVLKTPVQTAVKREDEQEFARLNGENLMFVEDALRRMQQCLDGYEELKDFKIKAHHFESLHQHNAVGVITKNTNPK